mmetsp:Transcript_15320/g.37422  ORF Transcript_15320/g.37422 Transcript_15320/m.37422 type:complete len:141 (+) Transcript_15320:88-510(+)
MIIVDPFLGLPFLDLTILARHDGCTRSCHEPFCPGKKCLSTIALDPSDHVIVSVMSGEGNTLLLIPGAVVVTSPLQDLKVAIACRKVACTCIPGAAGGTRPLQDLKVATFCGLGACALIQWASIGTGPSQHFQIAPLCGS